MEDLIIVLVICAIVIIFLLVIESVRLKIAAWKTVIITIVCVFLATQCARLMALIEVGDYSGGSYFGSVLFLPVFLPPLALILRIRIRDMFDLCAPAVIFVLVPFKIRCYINGCCYGRVISAYINEAGETIYTRFPSQIVEACIAGAVSVFLFCIVLNGKFCGRVYPLMFIVYGTLRFFINLMRETEPFVLGLSAGCFWSIIAVIWGVVWMLLYKPVITRMDASNIREKVYFSQNKAD